MKMKNPRAGHGPSIDVGALVLLLGGLIAGWPVAVPVFFALGYLAEITGAFKLSSPVVSVVLYVSMAVGTVVHYRLWAWFYSAIKEWWNG